MQTPDHLDKLWQTIVHLDLVEVARSASNKHGLPNLALEYAALPDYRAFLYLKAKYPYLEIVPTRLVDLLWHEHLSDTRKYHEDCERIAEIAPDCPFIHHDPSIVAGTRRFDEGVQQRNEVYIRHFARLPYGCEALMELYRAGAAGDARLNPNLFASLVGDSDCA